MCFVNIMMSSFAKMLAKITSLPQQTHTVSVQPNSNLLHQLGVFTWPLCHANHAMFSLWKSPEYFSTCGERSCNHNSYSSKNALWVQGNVVLADKRAVISHLLSISGAVQVEVGVMNNAPPHVLLTSLHQQKLSNEAWWKVSKWKLKSSVTRVFMGALWITIQ